MVRRVLGLDLSTHCGWAVLESTDDGRPELVAHGRMDLVRSGLPYPQGYVQDAQRQAGNLSLLVAEQVPDEVVIEETNGGGRAARYTQKLLEFLHLALLERLVADHPTLPVGYLSTHTWRSRVGARLSPEERKRNKVLRAAAKRGATELRAQKKALGVRGKTTLKHVAVRHVEETFNLRLPAGGHDTAEAICLAEVRLLGAAFDVPKPRSTAP